MKTKIIGALADAKGKGIRIELRSGKVFFATRFHEKKDKVEARPIDNDGNFTSEQSAMIKPENVVKIL